MAVGMPAVFSFACSSLRAESEVGSWKLEALILMEYWAQAEVRSDFTIGKIKFEV